MLTAIAVLMLSAGAPLEAACAVTMRDIAAGEAITADVTEPIACRPDRTPIGLMRFDRQSRSLIAREALATGTYLGRLKVANVSVLPKGARVTLRASSGPAIVERQVTTLQPGRAGHRVFVRDDSGNVFAVALIITAAPGAGQ